MITCTDIISFLDKNYNFKGKISDLANNPRIADQTEVYDFDAIKEQIYQDSRSADVLLIRKDLNLIEFKSGFISNFDSINEKVKKENMKLSLRIKAYESLHLLETAIIDEIRETDRLADEIRIVFCAVIDSNEQVLADDVYTDILLEEGMLRNDISLKYEIASSIMKIYRKETKKHKKLFYDDAFVLYDYEFDKKIRRFK